MMSLFQGDGSSFSPLINRPLDLNAVGEFNVLKTYQNHVEATALTDPQVALLHSRPIADDLCYLATLLTAQEVSLYTGLPQTEVPGIVLNNGVSFGLNEDAMPDEQKIRLGNMIQRGRELKDVPFYISQSMLAKHTFIAGVTGSGKTTTCHKILDEIHRNKTPFLILEPAKTEYRSLIRQYRDMIVFTLGNESVAPFRLNPFDLIEGEIISSHVDMLKATFTSAFPMEASMPQLLEEAIYACYKNKGWNIITNNNRRYGKAAWTTPEAFPILSELLEELKKVTKTKGFGERLQAEYIGSLVSRLSNLVIGSKGCMLNCRRSIDFHYLVNHDVIIEMEELKSPEDKALIMGLVLAKLSAVIKKEYKENNAFKHLTLVEEAHRLLAKPDAYDGGARRAAVETFSDLLAEVRKYGEGLLIIDQIPNKLATEVLKNTNTKIIQKLLARDDKEVVGDTMEMDNDQKEFLSSLSVGEAIVFTENTEKPVHIKIESISDTSAKDISDEKVKKRFDDKRRAEFNYCYTDMEITEYIDDFYEILELLRNKEPHEEQRQKLLAVIKEICDNCHIAESDIWDAFITKATDENSIADPKRKAYLQKFFKEEYTKADFTVEDLDIMQTGYFAGFGGF